MLEDRTVEPTVYAEAQAAALTTLARKNFSANLNPAEFRILDASTRPGPVKPLKDASIGLRRVRSSFMRWLVTDPEVSKHLDPNGFQIASALFDGPVDLSSCTITKDLSFLDCLFAHQIVLSAADVQSVYFYTCDLQEGLNAHNMHTTGDLLFESVRFGGNVVCDGSKLGRDVRMTDTVTAKDVQAISFSNVNISGRFELRQNVVFHCTLFLEMARIDGGLTLWSIRLEGSMALALGGTEVKGDVFFYNSFAGGSIMLDRLSAASVSFLNLTIEGTSSEISLHDARIGDLDIRVGLAEDEPFESESGFNMSGGSIKGDVICAPSALRYFRMANVIISGNLYWFGAFNRDRPSLDLSQSKVQALFDDRAGWPDPDQLKIDGFTYQDLYLCTASLQEIQWHKPPKLLHSATIQRIEWLKRQTHADSLNEQPWDQVAKVLQAHGDVRGARHVRFEYQSLLLRHQTLLTRAPSLSYDWIEEDPIRISIPLVSLWAFGFLIYRRAARMKAMAPTDSVAYGCFKREEDVSNYPPFNAAVYALENTLPALKLGHDAKWSPDPAREDDKQVPLRERLFLSYAFLSRLRWTLIVLGWALTLILAGAIGHLFAS